MALISTNVLEELVIIYSERYVTREDNRVLNPEETIRVVDEAIIGQDFQYDSSNRQHRAVRAQMYAFATDFGNRLAEYNEDHSNRYTGSASIGAFLGFVITGIATHPASEDPKDLMTVLLGALAGAALPTVYNYFSIRNRYTHAKSSLLNLYSGRLDRISRGDYSEEWEVLPQEVEAIVPQTRRVVIDVEEAPRALARRDPTLPTRKRS